ncbi:hypothetical protein SAMN05216227_104136 [Pseudorhodobacter antarcticus]|uniref:Uncharacterized protein n=1 Tax=Pseudorhodobacter antarcticus TaxID=1077947 RepID=A0A1H8LH90_9RHOB|nr:hypothetical protein [Pseudorhodobacter antarcticus]SEO04138.1 hypothetical protein SAMN05216227_104136 [Pseudorhodobacter antarcticus]
MTRCFAFAPLLCVLAQPVFAHDAADHCADVKASVAEAGFADKVTVTCEGERALVTSNT